MEHRQGKFVAYSSFCSCLLGTGDDKAICLDGSASQTIVSQISGHWDLAIPRPPISQGNYLFLGFALREFQRG